MARKKRDFDNFIKFRATTKEGKIAEVEIASYQVTATHVVLTKVEDSGRVTKYVTIDSMRSFEFDEPLNSPVIASRVAVAPLSAVAPLPAPEDSGRPIMTIRGQQVDLTTRKAIKKVKLPTEEDLVKQSLSGAGGAGTFA